MISTKIVNPSISFLKIVLFTVLSFAMTQSYAGYYVVYSAVAPGCGATPCCRTSCQERVVYKKYYPHKVVHKKAPVKRSYSNVTKYYVVPAYAGAVWVPACGGGCAQWVAPRPCGTVACDDFYIPPEYIVRTQLEPDYSDMRTSDDF